MFCNSSEEGSERDLTGSREVKKIDEKSLEGFMPLPHMGWNENVLKPNDLTNGIDVARGFYFLHSYQVVTDEVT